MNIALIYERICIYMKNYIVLFLYIFKEYFNVVKDEIKIYNAFRKKRKML